MDKTIQITNEGELPIGDMLIPCFVLADGTRVLSGRGFQEAIKVRDSKKGGYILPTFLDSKTLNPFIINKLGVAKLEPIIAYRGNMKIHGYEATVLADVCDAILEARRSGARLTDRQKTVADQCEILMRSFAKVGIIALIDEATGYQYEREKDALREIHKRFIAEELQPYVAQFPNKFYKEIFRLRGWAYTVKQIKYGQRPSVIGKWTKKYIYGGLPSGVLEILLSDGRLKTKLFQHLTVDEGIEALKLQINSVTTLLEISDSWTQFDRLWNKKFGQQELPFTDYSILEPENNIELSSNNKALKKALDFNPKKEK